MMTKDKKPFTYTPGGIDLSQIRSPRMQRRIARNACAEEMPGIPAPTTNHQVPVEAHPNTNYSAMQSQLPSQVLPPVGSVPPPPPPPPPSGSAPTSAPVHSAQPPAPSNCQPKPMAGRPPLGFDPNELLARVNKSPAYEPINNHHDEASRNVRSQPDEEKPSFEAKQQPKSNESGHSTYAPLRKEPVSPAVPQVTPLKLQNETVTNYGGHQPLRVQLGSPQPVASPQESATSSPLGIKLQHNYSPPVSSPLAGNAESKHQVPWATAYKAPQTSVPWANRDPEPPKSPSIANSTTTRIIPIQIEGRDSPASPQTYSSQPLSSPPPFLQSAQARQQSVAQQQLRLRQSSPSQQSQQPMKQQQPMLHQPQQQQQQQHSNTRVIPIQIEGASTQQPRSPMGGPSQQFSPMSPQSPTPYSPQQDREQKPQWTSVQPKSYNRTPSEQVGMQQHQQPEYGTYNTAGVPLSQLRKMQLSDDDRALMDKFKSQVEIHGNDILNDENTNPRYKGGYIPSRVFKMLDESVDDEVYLHRESDPRYRGAVIPSRAFRMLQCMTDTAGDMQQQVPRTPTRTVPNNGALGRAQYQQEAPQGPYVPPSEQQVQEPRKYRGGSIPSRSFRMLQAMTGQEVSAVNSSDPPSGRETPVPVLNRWCSSPSPSPVDPFWAAYYPPDPYFMYNYISDLNAAYGLPPPPLPPPPPFLYPRHPPSPSPHQTCQNCHSDNDEQGYSSTDELAQYYANYRRNFGYSPYQANPERSYTSTPNSFTIPRVCVTPVMRNEHLKSDKLPQNCNRETKRNREMYDFDDSSEQRTINAKEFENLDEGDESGTDLEVEDDRNLRERRVEKRMNSLQTLKSVSDINLYTTASSSTIVRDEYREADLEEEEEITVEEEEASTSESLEESEQQEPLSHQLSVIFEESECSEVTNGSRQEGCTSHTISVSESDSCSTIDNGDENYDDDNDEIEGESSVTVRLPLKVTCSRSFNDETITTVVVGDSEFVRGPSSKENSCSGEDRRERSNSSDSGDISVTFTIPSHSNSVKSIAGNSTEIKSSDMEGNDNLLDVEPGILGEPEVEAEITIHLNRSSSALAEQEEKKNDAKTEICESPQIEDDSSTTSAQSEETILNYKEDTDEEKEEDEEENKMEEENFVEEDCQQVDVAKEADVMSESYKEGVGRLEELISSMLESTRDTMNRSLELSRTLTLPQKPDLRKKESQEESEEDDSGVTSDLSMKQVNSETDAETESDYSELSKMSKFQRASTHSRLFKLLQEECEKSDVEEAEEVETSERKSNTPKLKEAEEDDSLTARKQKLSLSLRPPVSLCEVESLSSSSGLASPSSPTVSERLAKELIHSLLNKKKGKKFRKLPIAKLHAAALKILQEEMNSCDTSPPSGDDGFSPTLPMPAGSHSKLTNDEIDTSHSDYGVNHYDYVNYYNTWNEADDYPDDYDIVPSKAFRLLRESTNSPIPIEMIGFKARCPRVVSKPDASRQEEETVTSKSVSVADTDDKPDETGTLPLSFSEKQRIVSKVLEKSVKG
ncbi:hypothetical protein RUM44_004088 [Polyplax serrata]|uniref:Uncharacterized protein n=1 Tax=Polyplax serrata TaxID=468196 RepID=A0ABR1B2I7_POLSC